MTKIVLGLTIRTLTDSVMILGRRISQLRHSASALKCAAVRPIGLRIHRVNEFLRYVANRSRLPIVLACTVFAAPVHAQSDDDEALGEFVQADLFTEAASLQERIRFPQGAEDIELMVRCGTEISLRGRFRNLFCYSESSENFIYSAAVDRAARNARATPATVNGGRRTIWTIFAVVFARRDGVESITLYPNHLLSVEDYGEAYIAPQRYFTPHRNVRGCGLQRGVLLQHVVYSDGSASTGHLGGGSEQCGERYADYFSQSRYIPATLNGEFIEIAFREWLYVGVGPSIPIATSP